MKRSWPPSFQRGDGAVRRSRSEIAYAHRDLRRLARPRRCPFPPTVSPANSSLAGLNAKRLELDEYRLGVEAVGFVDRQPDAELARDESRGGRHPDFFRKGFARREIAQFHLGGDGDPDGCREGSKEKADGVGGTGPPVVDLDQERARLASDEDAGLPPKR